MKKAQAQIITTVLIILLVLAAIVIVWQVISNTINKGAKEIDEQSDCIGLRVDITNIDTTADTITIRPTKNIAGYRAFVNGAKFGVEGVSLDALDPKIITRKPNDPSEIDDPTISSDDEIEILGKIGDVWCTGTKKTA